LHSRNTDPISADAHGVWFQAVLENPDRYLYIGELDGQPIGQVRFDPVDSQHLDSIFEVSISLDPDMRGKGLAVPLLLAAEGLFIHSTTGAAALHAYVNPDNAASQGLFQSAGYSIVRSSDSESHWWVKEINV
jgi:UDP-2,4-diacetamido-2,4,6-trideoxy-beta-L-altropyranose hydrolase